MAAATPSWLLSSVITSAAASTSGLALPIATPSPAARIISRSLPLSPQAITWRRSSPSSAASASRPRPLFTPGAFTSRLRGMLLVISTPGQAAASAALAASRTVSSGYRMLNFSTWPLCAAI